MLGRVEHRHDVAVGVEVAVGRHAVAHVVAVAAVEHPEVRVVGVVLLHVDDDVLDLRQEVDALGPARVGPVARLTTVPGKEARQPAGEPGATGEHQAGARREAEEELPPRQVIHVAHVTRGTGPAPGVPEISGERLRIVRAAR